MTDDEIRDAVERGARLLDKAQPGWWQKVNAPLEMESCGLCVLGQIFGHYNAGVMTLGLEYDARVKHGFTTTDRFSDPDDPEWPVLEKLWLDAIKMRRESARNHI